MFFYWDVWDSPGLSYWEEIDLPYFTGCEHMWN
jgi:hypothetical protein